MTTESVCKTSTLSLTNCTVLTYLVLRGNLAGNIGVLRAAAHDHPRGGGRMVFARCLQRK